MEISSNSNSKMRRAVPRLQIAQVAPLYERIPPELYGGTERVVSYVTEELVNRGHDVTLFAAGDSETAAKLKPGCPQALRLVRVGFASGAHQDRGRIVQCFGRSWRDPYQCDSVPRRV